MPLSATHLIPPDLNQTLRPNIAKIYNNQISLIFVGPVPGDKILEARVVRPARSLAQAPLPLAKHRTINGFEEPLVELGQRRIRGLIPAPAQENRQSYLATFKLPFME